MVHLIKKLKEEIYDFHNKWLKKVKPLQIGEHLRFVQFSDSILLAVNGSVPKSVSEHVE